MKSIKKTILALGLMTVGLVSAQNSDMRNMLKVGVNGGFAVPAENASANIGVDLSYQNLNVENLISHYLDFFFC